MGSNEFLKLSGNYRNLKVYNYTKIIYDITFIFKERFLQIGDRTKDQMEQSARSIKQNLVEGNKAGKTSKQTEIYLTNVGIASLYELLEDYEDYLRVRKLCKWELNDPRTTKTRKIITNKLNNYNENVEKYFLSVAESRSDETLANIAITMLHMASKMLQGLQKRQQEDFIKKGGIKEQMYNARLQYRNSPKPPKSK